MAINNYSIPFNWPCMTGDELKFIKKAHDHGHLAGDGPFTKLCQNWLENSTGCVKGLLTHSCTAALELSALLLNIQPGDEVILPSYTFTSTANAFVLRGAVPVFVDIRADTLNLDEKLVEQAITNRTKAIVPVHYAGVSCDMDAITRIARKHDLRVVEDAAQGVMASYKGKALGSLGDLGAYSFHETKNVIAGEGGALLVNADELVSRAEILREKGTNRSEFFRGEVSKYEWLDVGSSFLPSELTAAFLWAQFEQAKSMTSKRLAIWNHYHELLEPMEIEGLLKRPYIPAECDHNAHMYYVVLDDRIDRKQVLKTLHEEKIAAIFHYVPLHTSPAGKRFGRVGGSLQVTDRVASQLIRLPLWIGLSSSNQARIIDILKVAMANGSQKIGS